MNPLTLALVLVATAPTPAAPTPSGSTEDGPVTVRVTSTLGKEDNDQVREVVSQRVTAVLADEGYTVEDGAPRLLLIRVGRSEESPTDYQVQISASGDIESAPKRVESFDCSCSAPELLDELDRRLATLLPDAFEKAVPAPPAKDPPPEPPLPASTMKAEQAVIDGPEPSHWRPHQDTSLFAAGVSTIGVGASILIGFAIGLPPALADDTSRVPSIAYATPALGVAGIVTGAVLLRVNKRRHASLAHLTSLAPLTGRF